jgi:hypothetical protein
VEDGLNPMDRFLVMRSENGNGKYTVLEGNRRTLIVSLWIRETVGGRRTYRKPNKKKIYADGTIFCLRSSVNGNHRWETPHR